MKIVIVEDEPLALQRIKSIISDNKISWEVVGTAQSIKELVAIFESELDFDLMICDIHLADGLSFKAFRGRNIDFPIIFITAFDQYALQSFDHNCIDYVLKPIQEERLLKAFEKLESLTLSNSPTNFNADFVETFLNSYSQKNYKKRFLSKTGNKIRFVPVEDVAYFYSEGGITYLVETGSAKKYIIDFNLSELENHLLDPMRFYRINRSMIIHLDSLVEMKPYFNGRLMLYMSAAFENDIVVARERVNEFKNWINQ
jgi:two-component system, LytTR family, response regulator LytT